MKKSLICLATGMLMLGMASCNSDSKSEQTSTMVLCSLMTPVDGAGEALVSENTYMFKMDYTNNTMTVGASNLDIAGDKFTLNLDPLTVSTVADPPHGSVLRITGNAPGSLVGSSVVPVENFSCSLYSYIVYNNLPTVPGTHSGALAVQPVLISYTAGNYRVRTFQSDTFVSGTTSTEFRDKEGNLQTYSGTSAIYRVGMNIAKKTADVIIYNAKFAEQMPEIKVLYLKDLTLTFDNNGYRISGKDVVPNTVEGSNLVPNSKFPFTSFELRCLGGNLTDVNAFFTVGEAYQGSFNGTILPVFKDSDK